MIDKILTSLTVVLLLAVTTAMMSVLAQVYLLSTLSFRDHRDSPWPDRLEVVTFASLAVVIAALAAYALTKIVQESR
jgi:hypothetical protein